MLRGRKYKALSPLARIAGFGKTSALAGTASIDETITLAGTSGIDETIGPNKTPPLADQEHDTCGRLDTGLNRWTPPGMISLPGVMCLDEGGLPGMTGLDKGGTTCLDEEALGTPACVSGVRLPCPSPRLFLCPCWHPLATNPAEETG